MIKDLPKISYDFSIRTENRNSNVIVMPDLIVRVDIDALPSDSLEIQQKYFISDGERIELISQSLYGTPDYFWTIMMINKKFDYVADYPMRSDTVIRHTIKKYGAGNEYSTHHYETEDGYICDEFYYDYFDTLNVNTGAAAQAPIWKKTVGEGAETIILKKHQAKLISNFEFETRVNDAKRHISVIKEEHILDFVAKFKREVQKIG